MFFCDVFYSLFVMASHCRSHQGLLHDSCKIFIGSFAFCYVHITWYPWLPKSSLPCCRSLAFILHSSIFMKLIKPQKFPKLDVFLPGKSLKLEFPRSCLFLLCSWQPFAEIGVGLQYCIFLLAHMPNFSTLLSMLVTLGPFALDFSFFSCHFLFLAC